MRTQWIDLRVTHAPGRTVLKPSVPRTLRGLPLQNFVARQRPNRQLPQLCDRLTVPKAASGGYAVPQDPSYGQQPTASEEISQAGNVEFGGALMNVLNILSGVGLLSVPYALRKAGWVGLGVLWLLGIVTNYTGKILVASCQEIAARQAASSPGQLLPEVGYEDAGEAAFGALGRKIVSTTMYTELLGICALLFILEGENMFKLLGTRLAPSADMYILIAAALMIPTVWLPDLKALSFLGVFGFAATLTVTGTVAFTFFTRRFAEGAATQMATWSQVPVVFGILAFVYAGHGVFPAIQASMKRPKDFPKVLNVAYVILASLCTFLGVAGYIMYGNNVLDVITFNLPAGVPATLCASIVLINPIAKLALTMEPVAAATTSALAARTKDSVLQPKQQTRNSHQRGAKDGKGSDAEAQIPTGMSGGLRRLAVRTGMALGCLTAACYVPFLALVMSLIGSLLTIGTAIILPVAIHLQVFKGRLSSGQVAWNVFVLLIGVGCAVSGTTSSVLAILKQSSA